MSAKRAGVEEVASGLAGVFAHQAGPVTATDFGAWPVPKCLEFDDGDARASFFGIGVVEHADEGVSVEGSMDSVS